MHKFIDEITMKLLTNKTNYAKYLYKTDSDKYEEQLQFAVDCKVFYKDIISITKDMCQCKVSPISNTLSTTILIRF